MLKKHGMFIAASDPSTGAAEEEEGRFEASLGYVARLCLKKTK